MLPNKKWTPEQRQKWSTLDINEDTAANQVLINKRSQFQQANHQQNARMKSWITEKLALEDKEKKIIELFSGAGNFTGIIANLGFLGVEAIEGSREAVDQLRQKQLKNVIASAFDIFNSKKWKMISTLADAEILVLDPPREGFDQLKLFLNSAKKIKKIVYISCNLDTFCRDLKSIQQEGWSVVEIQPVDIFPQTPHVEMMSILEK